MENLAGKTKADLYILKELSEAGIEVVEGKRTRSEVPYTLIGRLADWNFSRAWNYWMANAEDGKGLPLEVATELHERKYPISGENQPETYGQVIRVAGHCGCPYPNGGWANHYDDLGKLLQHDPKGESKRFVEKTVSEGTFTQEQADKYHFVKTKRELETLTAKSLIDSYHVDSQEGLNVLAGAIRTLHNIASSGTDPKEILRIYDKISALYTEWETETKQEGIEWLKKMPTILYGNGLTVDELIVAIKNEQEVVSIAKKWKDSKRGSEGIAQHFFEDGQITGFNYGNFSGPGQILNRGPEVDGMLRPHYAEVKQLRPRAAGSLELCMQALERPGPEYTGRSDGGMTVKIAVR
jgi:hypothetical protein